MKNNITNFNEQKQNEIARQSAVLAHYFNSEEWMQQANSLPETKYVPVAEPENKEIEIYVQSKKLKEYFDSNEWKEKQMDAANDIPVTDNSEYAAIEQIEKEIIALQHKLDTYKAQIISKDEQPKMPTASFAYTYPYSADEEWRQQEQVKELTQRIKEIKKPVVKQSIAIEKALDDISNYFKSEAWNTQQHSTEQTPVVEGALIELPEMLYSLESYN